MAKYFNAARANINVNYSETQDFAKLFQLVVNENVTAFDKNNYDATHIETDSKNVEIYFDKSKFKIVFSDAIADALNAKTELVNLGFVYSHKDGWRLKSLFEHKYTSESDFYSTVADVVIYLFDKLKIADADTSEAIEQSIVATKEVVKKTRQTRKKSEKKAS